MDASFTPMVGMVRVDLIDEEPAVNTLDRFTKVITIPTAMALAITLIKAIEAAEVLEAQSNRRKK